MKNHFFISYAGNKRTECEEIYKELNNNIDEIAVNIRDKITSQCILWYVAIGHIDADTKNKISA